MAALWLQREGERMGEEGREGERETSGGGAAASGRWVV